MQFAEDAKSFYEAQDCTVENNLFIFNNTTYNHVGMVTIKGGCKNILVRANTAVGHPKVGSAFSARIWTENNSMKNEDLYFYNNIFCDPNGGMVDFSDGNRTADVTGDCVLDNNLYWNNGSSIPADSGSIFDPDSSDANRNDPNGVFANPLLGNPSGMTIQRWLPGTRQFISGQTSIRGEFTRLVNLYGLPGSGSPAVNAANSDSWAMPTDDIFGRIRGASPDIGAVERVTAVTLTIVSGSGGGAYSPSQVVTIGANTVPGFAFSEWVGDTINVANPWNANTTIIANTDATITATYVVSYFDLTVISGSGSGSYTLDQEVAISANPAPTGMVFDQWTGDTIDVVNIHDPNTRIFMPGDATVTATYEALPPVFYDLTVISGGGSGSYTVGAAVNISANPAPTDMAFDQWTGDIGGVGGVYDPNTTFTMAGSDATVTATYRVDLAGDFNNDGTVDIIDLNMILIDWGKTGGFVDANSDGDGSGTVDIIDLNMILIDWGK